MEDWLQWVIAVVCLAVTVILQAEVALLFIGAGIVGILYYGSLFKRTPPATLSITVAPVLAQLAPTASSSILGKLLLFFLKAGSLTFGSGLVIVPFLEQGLVQQFGWLDQRQFLIAVAIGMISRGQLSLLRPSSAISLLDLGLSRLDDRHFSSVVSSCAHRRPIARTSSWQSQRAGIC